MSNNLQENPTFIAVSTLSPVNTHNLIPALRSDFIVSGTFYYNLSSIPVAPINVKPYSKN